MPCIISSVAGMIRIPNLSDQPLALKHNEHFCQLNSVFNPLKADEQPRPIPIPTKPQPTPKEKCFSTSINLDPAHLLPTNVFVKFGNLHKQFNTVFKPEFEGYNGASGPFKAKVNMGPVEPPQRTRRLPQYSHERLVELQQKFDKLEELGVFKWPEDVGSLFITLIFPS
ncbi:Hypothetical predicted protein [Paramuricea clavata]|uniref:Uncharacterized protein n=1 Tax=Paramuricea clavata TaxID=317549 RepID=A0A7D9IBD8_PARCT|nr:Hypothetical predicted protein [Paramuricea clavata]